MKNAILLAALVGCTAACADVGETDTGDAAAEAPSAESSTSTPTMVSILEPADGSIVTGTSVTVRLAVQGVSILPAGDTTSGSGHHHLFLDADLTDASVPVPTVPGSIVHMGDASSEYTFDDVAPGEHRLIAVVADYVHVPLQPWVVDTVTFTVN